MDFNKILRHPVALPVAVGVVSLGGGFAAGFILGLRKGTKDTAEEAALVETQNELEKYRAARQAGVVPPKVVVDADVHFAEEMKGAPDSAGPGFRTLDISPPTKPEVTVEEHIRRKLANGPMGTGEEEPPVVAVNVFAENISVDDNWDYEVEKRNRDSTTPYIIHRDEFFADEMEGFAKKTFTYYHGDDELVDDTVPRPKPIYNRHEVVGDNLKFGHGSGESHVVYIRNEQRREEYEVLKEDGMYSVAVLNYQIEDPDEIEHAHPRRFHSQE